VYHYDPERGALRAWRREAGQLVAVNPVEGLASPRLGIRFWPEEGGMRIERPDGTAFESFTELAERAEQERQRADRLAERLRALGMDPNAGE
jgi:hypothetical protein